MISHETLKLEEETERRHECAYTEQVFELENEHQRSCRWRSENTRWRRTASCSPRSSRWCGRISTAPTLEMKELSMKVGRPE